MFKSTDIFIDPFMIINPFVDIENIVLHMIEDKHVF